MKTVSENSKVVSCHFDGILELMDYDCDTVNKNLFHQFMKETSSKETWFGPGQEGSAETVIKHALLGDIQLYKEHLIPKIKELDKACGQFSADVTQTIKQTTRKRVKRQFGDELDIHKVYQGKLDTAWSSTVRIEQDREHKLVTLLCHIGGNASERAIDTLWGAAAIMKLVGNLEKAGKSVQIMIGGATERTFRKDNRTNTTSIVLKHYNEQLSVTRLAAMAHLGFYRTFCFSAKAAAPYLLMGNLGYSVDFSIAKNLIPVELGEEIARGHTKIIIVPKSTSLNGAIQAVESAKKQSEKFN